MTDQIFTENKKEQVLYSIAGCILIAVIVYAAFFWGRESTPSCTSDYIKGTMTLQTLHSQCPALTKDDLANAVNDYFRANTDKLPTERKDALLREIENSDN